MRKGMRRLAVWITVIILAVIVPLNFFGRNVNASDGTEHYTIRGYDRNNNVKDSEGHVISGHTFCANYSMGVPNGNEYIRYRLSEFPGTVCDSCPTSKSEDWGNDGWTPAEGEEAEVRQLLLNFIIKKDNLDLHDISAQYVVWFITCGKFCDSFYSDGSSMDDRFADIKAQLTAAPYYTFSDYDVYYYYSIDEIHQHTLGTVFQPVDTSLELHKIVIDGIDNTEVYNGLDDSQGFTINIHIDDTLNSRVVPNEAFIFTHTSSDGSTSTETITTDSNGDLSLTIYSGETVAISGFDSIYYSFTISESDANTDDTCNLDGMDSASTTLTDNGDGSYTFDFSESYVVDINITNRHISADPTPVPTTETTTEAATTTSESTSASVDATAATTTSESTTASSDPQVLGAARAEETTTAATPTPTSAPSNTPSTGEHSGSACSICGIILIAAGSVVFSVRHVRKQQMTR